MQEMDTKGIGTDATIASHIKTIQERRYAVRNNQQRFEPTQLGLALVEGYEAIGYAMTKVTGRCGWVCGWGKGRVFLRPMWSCWRGGKGCSVD